MKSKTSFKYRIYLNNPQTRKCNQILESCRFVYNKLIDKQNDCFDNDEPFLTAFDMNNIIPHIREYADIIDINIVNNQVVQNISNRIANGITLYEKFGCRGTEDEKSKINPPKFKRPHTYTSFTYPQEKNTFKIISETNKNYLRASTIPGNIKIKYHIEIPLNYKIKTLTIKKEGIDWYAIFSCEHEIDIIKICENDNKVGIDFGLKNFLTLNNGEVTPLPKFFFKSQKKLKTYYKKRDKFDYNSKYYNKWNRLIAKLYKRINFKRNDFQHKIANMLLEKYDLIIIEDLSIKPMIDKNNKTSNKNIRKLFVDASFHSFVSKLLYKAERLGKTIIKVNPAYTSQTCSHCNQILEIPLKLKNRIFNCPVCGFTEDRDVNAANNIMAVGLHSQILTFS